MINLKIDILRFGLCALALIGVISLGAGCSQEEEPVVVNRPPPPPPPEAPPPPAVTPIEQLMAEMNIDPRVSLSEDKAPDNDIDRRAVLAFFDAFARGNDKAVQQMLPETDRPQLATLVESGAWKDTTTRTTKIGVQCGNSPLGDKCALAVFEVSGGGDPFQPQLWTYDTSDEEQPRFEAVASPPGIMDRLSGNWISRWFELLEEEMALANAAEEEYMIAQRDLDEEEEESSSASGGEPSGPAGVGPGMRPPPKPRKAPAAPGAGGGG
jgi:hypothetical protein